MISFSSCSYAFTGQSVKVACHSIIMCMVIGLMRSVWLDITRGKNERKGMKVTNI